MGSFLDLFKNQRDDEASSLRKSLEDITAAPFGAESYHSSVNHLLAMYGPIRAVGKSGDIVQWAAYNMIRYHSDIRFIRSDNDVRGLRPGTPIFFIGDWTEYDHVMLSMIINYCRMSGLQMIDGNSFHTYLSENHGYLEPKQTSPIVEVSDWRKGI